MNKILFILFILISGCGVREPNEVEIKMSSPNYGVSEFTLDDGTRCVKLFGNSIDCDWK